MPSRIPTVDEYLFGEDQGRQRIPIGCPAYVPIGQAVIDLDKIQGCQSDEERDSGKADLGHEEIKKSIRHYGDLL